MSQTPSREQLNGIPQTGYRRVLSSSLFAHDAIRFTPVRKAHRLEGILLICSEPPTLSIRVRNKYQYFTADSGQWRHTSEVSAWASNRQQRRAEHLNSVYLQQSYVCPTDLSNIVVEGPD